MFCQFGWKTPIDLGPVLEGFCGFDFYMGAISTTPPKGLSLSEKTYDIYTIKIGLMV